MKPLQNIVIMNLIKTDKIRETVPWDGDWVFSTYLKTLASSVIFTEV